ncbi:MAG: DDE-type integrase/transposase/recombinase, partial [Planctomycetes bacterium]|nr:DDE-type integrase/transposase/recombinase [Planctomycetota bacterium]
ITLAGTITTAAARRLSATLAGLASALDRWAALHDPATAELTSALHRGWVGKKRCPTRDRHDVRRALRDLTAPTRLDKLVQTHRHVMMVLGDGDPSVPRLRQITTVYARVALIVLTTITARAYRLGSRVIKRIEGLTLNVGLAIAARLLRTRGSLVAHACFLSGRSGIAWCAFDSLLVATYLRLYPPMVLMRMRPFWILALLPLVSSAGDESKRVPSFSGERIDFTAWFMLFSAYVAYKLVSAASLVAGTRPKPPAAPPPTMGRVAPEPPAPPAPILATDGSTTNQAEIDAANAARLAWMNTAQVVLNAAEIKEANDACEKWANDNTQLYGLLVQAMPAWLVTSLYNTHLNDGVAAIEYLRKAFDANVGDGGDHAAHLARLQSRTIDARSDISEADLRRQFDMMMSESAAIQRTGNAPPSDATMIAFYDNALPIAYTTMRQHARRAKHTTFLEHHMDMMSQVRAEVNSRAPAPNAFAASVAPAGVTPLRPPTNADTDKTCLRCGRLGHTRRTCKQAKVPCTHCSADHLPDFCPKGTGGRRRELSDVLRGVLDRDVQRGSGSAAKPGRKPQTYAAAAAQASAPAPASASPPMPPPSAAAPPIAPTAPAVPWQQPTSTAHAAAAQAAAAQADAQSAANAYAAALRAFGYGMMAHLDFHAYFGLSATWPRRSLPAAPPFCSSEDAAVDSMASLMVVNSVDKLYRVTDASPKLEIETADGLVPVKAVGVALAYLRVGTSWECYEIPDVMVLENCAFTLYSTRVMYALFGFKHAFESGVISVPGAHDIAIYDTGAAYVTPIAFVPHGSPQPEVVHRATGRALDAFRAACAGRPAARLAERSAGTSQAVLHQRLGFPYHEQWKRVPASTADHGLPPNAQATPDLPTRDAVSRGRARALPFLRKPLEDVRQPPPAAVIYMDFAGPLLASIFHRYTCYVCCVDAGSGYGRLYPAHHMTALVAAGALESYSAELASLMGFHGGFKPLVVRSDQGSAFVSFYFREFLSARQIHQSLACTYTPQQNSHAERFFGVVFATARVLLAAANLPPIFHPFAIQTAAWIHNRLPRPSRGNETPYYVLTRSLPSLAMLYCFGCLAAVVIPVPRREGDRHFADRGEHAIYLGPSEVSPGHVVYLLSSRRITTVAKIHPWEDQFPGIAGERYSWFTDDTPPLPSEGPAVPTAAVPTSVDTAVDVPTAARDGPTSHGPTASVPDAADAAPPAPTPTSAAPPPPTPPAVVSGGAIGSGGAVTPGGAPATSGGATATPGGAAPQRSARPRGESRKLVVETTESPPDPAGAAPRRPGSRVGSSVRYGQIAMQAAMSLFALTAVAAANLHAPISFGFAFTSTISSVDEAFGGKPLDSQPDSWLVDAAALAATAATLTITADLGELDVPKSFRQAMRSPQRDYWREAIAKELAGLLALETWEMVPASSMPPGANLMHCHYVFTVKRKADGSIEKFKARLVADGNTQKHGIDFDRVFATVVKTSTIRLVLLLAAARDYNLSSIDIRQAYLQSLLNPNVPLYMRPPPDVFPFDQHGNPLVCKLRRSLYGLKQAGREWAALFSSFLISWGMTQSTIDPCLYVFQTAGSILWICVYVDDALIADNDPELRARFVADLSARFPTEDKGELKWILSVAITRDRQARTLSMSQELYVTDLITKFGSFLDASVTRTFDTPMEEGSVLSAADQPQIGSEAHAAMAASRDVYMSLVGGYLWLANMTHFHLAYPAGQLARFLTNPGLPHFRAALRLLAHLQSVGSRPLVFAPNSARGLDTYVDSSWATRFSVSGCLIFYHGCLFHWFSKMQKSVSLSSAEAEYFGAMMAARDLIFVRDLLVELAIPLEGPSVMWSDSKSAVDMSRDPVAFKMTKHILRAAEFLRDLVARLVVEVRHLPGRVMVADLLTKAVARVVYHELLRLFDAYAATGVVCPD